MPAEPSAPPFAPPSFCALMVPAVRAALAPLPTYDVLGRPTLGMSEWRGALAPSPRRPEVHTKSTLSLAFRLTRGGAVVVADVVGVTARGRVRLARRSWPFDAFVACPPTFDEVKVLVSEAKSAYEAMPRRTIWTP